MTSDSVSDLSYADTLWKSADALRRQVDAVGGKLGRGFYTPRSVVRVLVEMLEPYAGRVYDPACGSGGMFVQSEKFSEAHGGNKTPSAIVAVFYSFASALIAAIDRGFRRNEKLATFRDYLLLGLLWGLVKVGHLCSTEN